MGKNLARLMEIPQWQMLFIIFFPKKSICSAQDQFVYILSKVAEGEEELGAPELPCLKQRVVKNAAKRPRFVKRLGCLRGPVARPGTLRGPSCNLGPS